MSIDALTRIHLTQKAKCLIIENAKSEDARGGRMGGGIAVKLGMKSNYVCSLCDESL